MRSGNGAVNATVLVMGDLGRSPRMQYHALSLADAGVDVDLIGLSGRAPLRRLGEHPRVRLHVLADRGGSRPGVSRLRFYARSGWRFGRQGIQILTTLLFSIRPPDLILVQNPPALPALPLAWMAARARSARLIIDWHNLTHSMLAMRLGAEHPGVRAARRYEGALARRADGHLCVSEALAVELAERWNVRGSVVYDRPPAHFRPLAAAERQDVLRSLCDRLGVDRSRSLPRLVVTSTSWTEDEDIALLLEAAVLFERRGRSQARPFPQLLVLITGDGPGRARYEERLHELGLRTVHLRTAWFAAEEYPRIIAAADLGLSLHRSSSGLDLPMKIADMLGCATPVCALDYAPCLREVLRPGENAVLFCTAEELASRFFQLFAPEEDGALVRLREAAADAARIRWEDEWESRARVLLAGRVGS